MRISEDRRSGPRQASHEDPEPPMGGLMTTARGKSSSDDRFSSRVPHLYQHVRESIIPAHDLALDAGDVTVRDNVPGYPGRGAGQLPIPIVASSLGVTPQPWPGSQLSVRTPDLDGRECAAVRGTSRSVGVGASSRTVRKTSLVRSRQILLPSLLHERCP